MIWVSGSHAMPSERVMKKLILLILVVIFAAYAGIGASVGEVNDPVPVTTQEKKKFEPAGKFVPTEKLRADDAVAFPVDI